MLADPTWRLSVDRFFDPEPSTRTLAHDLYVEVRGSPLVCPHGHVDPRLFADPDYSFGTPVDLLIRPDHYVFRMLYSRGLALEALGLEAKDGAPLERDHRRIWQLFAENFYLFQATPTGIWLQQELIDVFDVHHKPGPKTAQLIYDQIAACLAKPEYRPRALYKRFNIQTLCTTDPAWDRLELHRQARRTGFTGDLRPTFRPDGVVNLGTTGWRTNLERLSEASGVTVRDYPTYIQAVETQRAYFKEQGALATDHAALQPHTVSLSGTEAGGIFQRALIGRASPADAARFTAHMLMEMARMSIEDGLVMQLHPGSHRNHNTTLYNRFGADMGADIPQAVEFTRGLKALLNRYGSHPKFRLIVFTLDESTYARELAPLAGHYPALRLGPPWWFFDSLNGMRRYFDLVVETAGLYNTAGFNDDTRAFCSIPARHDVWRRASANWLAGLVARHVIDLEDARQMMRALAYGLARDAYRLPA